MRQLEICVQHKTLDVRVECRTWCCKGDLVFVVHVHIRRGTHDLYVWAQSVGVRALYVRVLRLSVCGVCTGDDLGGRLYESREEREICMGGRLG